jgi:hypothetical protein
MKADSPAEKIPLLVGPAWRHRKFAEESAGGLARGFVRGLGVADSAYAMQTRGGAHDAAHVLLAESGSGVRAAQCVEERDREAGNFCGAVRARIGGASGCSQARHRGKRETFALRQAVAPIVPEACLAESELAIGFDALIAFAMDDFLPDVVRVGQRVLCGLVVWRLLLDDFFQEGGEDVEIMDVAEQILEAFEIFAPEDVVIWEEIFDGIAEALDADAQFMPGGGTVGALCAGVEIAGFVDAFDGEALRGEARWRDEANAAAELLFEARPRFDVEFFDGAESVIAKIGLALGEVGAELGAERVAFGGELLDPVVHDLGVAQGAETPEKLAREAAEFVPRGIGVDFLKDGGDGAATADGDAEIVDGIGCWIFADRFEFFEDALHGFAETAFGRSGAWNGDNG